MPDHLALQDSHHGASVYSLVTKQRYFGKPTNEDYTAAFKDLTDDFKKINLKHLICSPIGCVRDNVSLTKFTGSLL